MDDFSSINKALLMPEIMTKEQMEKVVQEGNMFGEFIAYQRHTDEDRKKYAQTIQDFNQLWWDMYPQTWWTTKWRGVTVLKPATDLWIYQELIVRLRPDLIIETGTFCGGSALFMHDILQLENMYGKIITIDINDKELDQKFKSREARNTGLMFYHGSSIDPSTIQDLHQEILTHRNKRVMVILDSCHDEDHVLKELELYAPFVSIGMPLIVEDTSNHPGPKGAVKKWYAQHQHQFKVDYICEKYMLTFNRDGYFERISERVTV